MAETPTLREVAELAGVSLGTASHALNNKPNVSAETRARVLNAAASLGYKAQVRVSTPMTVDLSVVGLLTKSLSDFPLPGNPFFAEILAGAERECQRQGLSLMYANLEVDEHNEVISWPAMLAGDQADGLIIVGAFVPETLTQIRALRERPVVLVDAYAPGYKFDSIINDNLTGAYTAVKYLIEQGHKHIGLVGSQPDAYPSIRERRKGYQRALKEAGIEAYYFGDCSLRREAAYDATYDLLQRAPEITAIFACNDNLAIGVMDAAYELGRRVPDDLSIVGFDDIDWAQEVKPPLTTVHVDKLLMGVMAVRHLRDLAESPGRTNITTVLGTQLIIRGSVCPLR